MQFRGYAFPVVPRMARKTSRRSGTEARFSAFSRNGVSVRTSVGVYTTVDPARDQRGLALLPDRAALLPPPPLPPDGSRARSAARTNTRMTGSCGSGYYKRSRPLWRSLSDVLLLVPCISPWRNPFSCNCLVK